MELRPRTAFVVSVALASVAAATGAGHGALASPDGGDSPSKTTGVDVPTTVAPAPPVTAELIGAPTTALPAVGISTVPPTTVPPVAPPPQFTFGSLWTVGTDVGGGPQFTAGVILPPTALHPWLMIGDYRSNPGGVTQVVAYRAPVDAPDEWVQAGYTGEEQPTSVRAAVNMPDGTALIFGSADGATGPSPAAWTYDGTTFTGPEIVGPETPFGRVTSAAVAADGTVYAVIQRYTVRQRVSFELGTRAPDGTWTFIPLDLPAYDIGLSGVAVSGSIVVLAGDGAKTPDERGYQALAFTSVDGGATFQLADTASLASPDRSTSLGAITTGPAGFYAAACLGGPGATRQGIATSADGITWTEVPFAGPESVVPMLSAGCDEIAVDEEGGVWLAGFHTFEATYYRVFNGAVDRVAMSYVQGQETQFDTRRRLQFAVAGGTVALATPQIGGPATGFAPVASTADAAAPYEVTAVGVAPASHEIVWDLRVINDIGNVVGLQTFPQVADTGDSTVYRRRTFPYTLSADGQPTPAPTATPVDPETGAGMSGVVTLASGEVAVASVAETVPSDLDGTIGDVAVSRRAPGGEWSPLEVILGEPGGQVIRDVTVVGGLVVAVGDNLVMNTTTHVEEGKPFVLFGDGTSFARLDLDPDVAGSNLASVYSVCALPDSRALVVGFDWLTRTPFSALVDLTAGTVQVNQMQIAPASAIPQRCVGAREGAFVEVQGSSFDLGNILYETRDGITFSPVDVLADDDAMYRIRSGAAGLAIVGITGPAGEDAFLLFGPSIDSLQRVDVPGFTGAGVQVANDVVIGDHALYVIGTINASPVVWPIAFG